MTLLHRVPSFLRSPISTFPFTPPLLVFQGVVNPGWISAQSPLNMNIFGEGHPLSHQNNSLVSREPASTQLSGHYFDGVLPTGAKLSFGQKGQSGLLHIDQKGQL